MVKPKWISRTILSPNLQFQEEIAHLANNRHLVNAPSSSRIEDTELRNWLKRYGMQGERPMEKRDGWW